MHNSLSSKKFLCNFRYQNGSIQKDPALLLDKIEDGKLYSTYLVVCPLVQRTHDRLGVPESVGFSYEEDKEATTFTKVKYPKILDPRSPSNPVREELAICVPAFHHDYNKVLRLVEFVELYQLLGATKFYFYNQSVGEHVEKILSYYKNVGKVEVLDWDLFGKF